MDSSEYRYPFYIDDVRYLLNYDPVAFSEEVVEKHFPDLVEERYDEILFQYYLEEEPEDRNKAHREAVIETAEKVLQSPFFAEWFEEEGHSMEVDIEQFRITHDDEDGGYGEK